MAMDQLGQRGPMRGEERRAMENMNIKEPRPVSVIESQLRHMDDRIDVLGMRIEQLAARISNVLRYEDTSKCAPNCNPATGVPLGDALSANIGRLQSLIEKLDNINERVEL